MSLQDQVMSAMKSAMKNKDTVALDALRAIKSALLLAKTQSGAHKVLKEEEETALLQKLVKQRKDSAAIYTAQNREDLAAPELAQVMVIEKFLPQPLSKEELSHIIDDSIAKTGAQGMKDMGVVMGMTVKAVAGKVDSKTISEMVKQKLRQE